MSDDPFAGLTDTVQERKERGGQFRKQKWVAFWASLGATVVVAVAAGAGGALGGWLVEDRPDHAPDRLLGGLVCGFAGGVFFFLTALWRITRQTIRNDMLRNGEDIDVGATLFWSTAVGVALLGCTGAALGLAGKGAFRVEVLASAIATTLLALVPVVRLRRLARRRTRTSLAPATPWKRE